MVANTLMCNGCTCDQLSALWLKTGKLDICLPVRPFCRSQIACSKLLCKHHDAHLYALPDLVLEVVTLIVSMPSVQHTSNSSEYVWQAVCEEASHGHTPGCTYTCRQQSFALDICIHLQIW